MGVLPVGRLLLSMSIPMMASMLVQALYNVVDSIFVAQINENALTAVSLAFPVQNLMIAFASGTAIGVNALLSKSLGEKNFKRANQAANNGIFLFILTYIAFAIFGLVGSRAFFQSQTDIAEIVAFGTDYLFVCTTFSFALFGQIILERLLQSTGKTFYAMITQTVGAVVNIILDPIMIFGLLGFPAMGVKGAAIATVIGQICGMSLALWFNLRKNHEIRIAIREFKPNPEIVKRIYSVGVPSVLMISIGSIMSYFLNRILLSFTETATAVFGVYFRLQSFVFMPVFGLNQGVIPIVAYNFGARKKERILKAIRLSITCAVCIMLTGLVLLQLFPYEMLMLFNATENMLAIGIPALRTISLSFVFAGFCVVASGVFQALGNGILSLAVSVIRQLVVLLPAAYLLSLSGTVTAVWWAFPIAEIASVIFSALFLKRVYSRQISKLDQEVVVP
ncbi:putative efflux protein, MATE family [Thermoclostridium caenicola]|uniref:Probable multidrug resistance protein NorM n=2 Tax=Thermoclostridium caenicola TaxID=659425 RepID=A0A1M6CI70_9FIRM|nr:putative efflux protein, MATE family [Thermoclostridium caenicola]